MTTLTVATYNIKRTLSFETFKAEVQRISATNADVIGLQECHADERVKWLRQYPDNWSTYQPSWWPGDPILWRSNRFEFVGHGSELISKGRLGLYPDRYLHWVELRHRNHDKPMFFANFHGNAHIEKAGHPYRLPRVPVSCDAFAEVVHTVRYLSTEGLVWITGDLNVDYDADKRVQYPRFPYVTFGNAHLVPCWKWGEERSSTHGGRTIDYVYHRRSAHIEPQSLRILRDAEWKSDHRPVLATYNVT